jgi:hypothetical protein
MRTNIGLRRILGDTFTSDSKLGLSVQAAVSCGFYTQGCTGGLEMLVHRFAQEAGIPEKQCMQYEAKEKQCRGECFQEPTKLVYAKDYGYVGGLYGLCSETRIMRNLYERGPLTVAIHSRDAELGQMGASFLEDESRARGEDFVGVKLETKTATMSSVLVGLLGSERLRKYLVATAEVQMADGGGEVSDDNRSGVLYVRASVVNRDWSGFLSELRLSLKEKAYEGVEIKEAFGVGIHSWRYIDHSVAVVGWGNQPEPHWIIRNSWAQDLPGGGYTKIRRGRNKGEVESAAVWVEPDFCRGKPRDILEKAGKLMLVPC